MTNKVTKVTTLPAPDGFLIQQLPPGGSADSDLVYLKFGMPIFAYAALTPEEYDDDVIRNTALSHYTEKLIEEVEAKIAAYRAVRL